MFERPPMEQPEKGREEIEKLNKSPKESMEDARERMIRETEEALAKAMQSGLLTEADIKKAEEAAKNRLEEKNVQIKK